VNFVQREFSEDQIVILHKNGRAIEKYIKDEIMPYCLGTARAPFGMISNGGENGERSEADYVLTVSKNEMYCECRGGIKLLFEDRLIDPKSPNGAVSIWDREYDTALSALYNLCLNWTNLSGIKSILNTAVQLTKDDDRIVFESFEV